MSEASTRCCRLRRVGWAVCLSGYMLLPSCFTSALWSDSTAEIHYDLDTGEAHAESDLAAKLCLTPFTLLLDLVTCPLQVALLAEDDEPVPEPRHYVPAPRPRPQPQPQPCPPRPHDRPRDGG